MLITTTFHRETADTNWKEKSPNVGESSNNAWCYFWDHDALLKLYLSKSWDYLGKSL